MPRVIRQPKRRRTSLSVDQVEQLQIGRPFFGPGFGGDQEALEAAWKAFRVELLREWVAEHPGTRPWAWWRFDAPELRRRVDGRRHPFFSAKRAERVARLITRPDAADDLREQLNSTSFGVPCAHVCVDDAQALYETEHDFLARHDMLLPGEEP